MKFYRNILILMTILLFSACSSKTYHEEMVDSLSKTLHEKSLEGYQNSYAQSLIKEKNSEKKYIDITKQKSVKDVLKELELIDEKVYFLKSSDVLLPISRFKIKNFEDLSEYMKTTLDRGLELSKTKSISLVKILSISDTLNQEMSRKRFNLKGDITVEELLKLITLNIGYKVSIGSEFDDLKSFQNSVINLNAKNFLDVTKALSFAKNIYVDLDHQNRVLQIQRYKDIIVELNIPIFDLKSTNSSSSTSDSESQTLSGESSVENTSEIVLYDELETMLKSIISEDKIAKYHIDKSSGLIFLKGTKNIEKAVRNVVKAYEDSFSKEAVIEFERIEIALNKNRKFGIATLNKGTAKGDYEYDYGTDDGERDSLALSDGGNFNFLNQRLLSNLNIVGTLNNGIGKIVNYGKNLMVLKNNIPSIQNVSENFDYIEEISTTVNNDVTTQDATVGTIKDGTTVTAMAKISRDKIFLNITPSIKRVISIDQESIGDAVIQLPRYTDQSYNISREIKEGETVVVGSIIVHDDAKEYEGILPIEGFAIGGSDSKSYIRKEIVYVVTLKSIKGH